MVQNGDIEKVKILLESGKASTADEGILTGNTMLDWAVANLQAEMVEILVQNGANANRYPHTFYPSASDLAWDLWLHGLGLSLDEPATKALLGNTSYVDGLKLPEVHKIVLDLSSKSIDDELAKNPEAVHAEDMQWRSALSWAVASGRRYYTFRLLSAGADPNTLDKHNKTPLHLALEYWSELTFDLVLMLLDFGAEPDPIMPYFYPERNTPLLCAAVEVGDLRVLSLLLSHNANIDAQDLYGQTALHHVAKDESAEFVALLLGYGAKMCLKDRNGKTAIDVAVEYGNLDVVRFFMEVFYPHPRPTPEHQVEFERMTAVFDDKGDLQLLPRRDSGYAGPTYISVPLVDTKDLMKSARKQLQPLWYPKINQPRGLAQKLWGSRWSGKPSVVVEKEFW